MGKEKKENVRSSGMNLNSGVDGVLRHSGSWEMYSLPNSLNISDRWRGGDARAGVQTEFPNDGTGQ